MDKEVLIEYLKEVRRTLHAMPELSGAEYKTSEFICSQLKSMGIPYKTFDTAVIAEIKGTAGGRIAFRADMDALPIIETGERALKEGFASKNAGVMHACGHDGHMTMLLGAAKILSKNPPKSNIRLIFQPAEEHGGGAEMLISKGALNGIDAIFGLHLSPEYPAKKLALSAGAIFAGAVDFTLTFKGRGAHCAEPDKAIDALSAAVMYCARVKDHAKNYKNTLLNIGRFQSGTKGNIIADEALLEVTFRYYDETAKEDFFARMQEILNDIYNTTGAEHCLKIDSAYPPLINSKNVADMVIKKFDTVPAIAKYTAEDFAFYLKKVPGVFAWLGVDSGKNFGGLHTSNFDFEEEILLAGVEYFVAIADNVLIGQ